MHHIKQLVEKLSDGAFPTENIPLCNTYILYNLIDSWNKCKNDYKMAGNHRCLKNMIQEDTLEDIEDCTIKDCTICNFDKDRDYEKYKNYK